MAQEMIKEMIQEISAEAFLHLTINDTVEKNEEEEVDTQVEKSEEEVDTQVENVSEETENQVENVSEETENQVENVSEETENQVENVSEEEEETETQFEVDENKEQQDMIDDENRIVSDQQVAVSTVPEEVESSDSETDSDDDMSKLYIVLINNQNKFVVNTKSKARQIVAEKVKEFLEYYSADDSVYRVFVTIKDNTYTISGYYKFMTIQCETVFETLKIEEIEKLN